MKFFAVFSLLLMANLAFAAADNDAAATKEELAESLCACPRILRPVCGDDSVTYPNDCEFHCVQEKLARRGRSIAIAHSGNC